MSEENHSVEVREEKCNCFCHSKGFKKFLVIALGSFVGVFCALSLFAALHKPPMIMPPCPCGCQSMMRPGYAQHFDRGDFRRFHKHHMKYMDKFRPDRPIPPRGMEGPGPVQPPVQR